MSYEPNVPKAPPPGEGGNRALYFIVGGLVVLAAVFVFIFTNNDAALACRTPRLRPRPSRPRPGSGARPGPRAGRRHDHQPVGARHERRDVASGTCLARHTARAQPTFFASSSTSTRTFSL